MRARAPWWPPLALALLICEPGHAAEGMEPAPGSSSAEKMDLPPPDAEALGPRAPTPDWDVGVLAGVCGVGTTAVWQGTEFCGALLTDVLWLREKRQRVGLGLFALVGTAGFYDVRVSLGPSVHVPTGQVFSLGARMGPLLHAMGDGVAPGFSVAAEFGIRALNRGGHYALTHALVVGWDQSFGDGSRVGSALTLGLRIDGFWLAAPLGMLF